MQLAQRLNTIHEGAGHRIQNKRSLRTLQNFRCTGGQNPPKCRAMNPTKLSRLTTAATLLLALAITAQAQQQQPAITTDPPRDKDFPAAMEAPDIISHSTRLNA